MPSTSEDRQALLTVTFRTIRLNGMAGDNSFRFRPLGLRPGATQQL
jgi:hypothetical protein